MARRIPRIALAVAGVAIIGCSANPRDPDKSSTSAPCRQTFTYKTVGDCEIRADVYRLPGDDVRPAILWIHGGALMFGHRGTLLEEQADLYLRAGYVIVSIDYRLAPESKLPAILEDVDDAYRWMRERGPELFHITRDHIAIVGNSAGGYLTLMAGIRLRPRPRALVSFYGYGDITGEWTTRPSEFYLDGDRIKSEDAEKVVGEKVLSESPTFPRVMYYNYCRQNGLWPNAVTGFDPAAEPTWFDAFCPVRHVTKDYPPTLLLHGDQDSDVPFAQSQQMAAALEQSHVPHQLLCMEKMDHLFDKFPNGWEPNAEPIGLKHPRVAEAFDQVVAFLNTHVGR
jgi:acetyl esterase/lipase